MQDFFTQMFSLDRIIQLVIIVIAAYAGHFVIAKVITRLVRNTVRGARFKTKQDEIQREDTLISILNTASTATIVVVAILSILGVFGINIAPILTGAGVLGVALGFGAQSMVKDFLAGIFIIAENQYRVGDVLQVNSGVSGVVEKVSLRATVLRDLDGKVHYIPNGNIEIATNMTMEYANVDLNINVAYGSDLDKVEKVIGDVGKAIFEDPAWKDISLEPPHMLRVDEFSDSAIVIKIVGKTAPIRQWEVKSEILRRLKPAFEKAAIEIAFPQLVVHEPSEKK